MFFICTAWQDVQHPLMDTELRVVPPTALRVGAVMADIGLRGDILDHHLPLTDLRTAAAPLVGAALAEVAVTVRKSRQVGHGQALR